MTQYKRLTKRKKDGSVVLNYFSNDLTLSDFIAHRLAELEDEIENGTLVPKYSIVDSGNTYCVCTVDTDNLLIVDEYETKAEAEKRLKEIRK